MLTERVGGVASIGHRVVRCGVEELMGRVVLTVGLIPVNQISSGRKQGIGSVHLYVVSVSPFG